MRIFAFHGLRFAGADPGRLAVPPFDQIDDELRDRLHASDERRFAHLTRPAPGRDEEPPARAARLHRSWRQEGAVRRDETPALYPYEILLAGGGRRLGICALAGIEPADSDRIRPHEQTVSKTIRERLELLGALRADLEPIFLLADDRGRLDELLEADLGGGGAPVAEHEDPFGHRHRLYRIDERARVEAYRAALAPAQALVADGNHRYRVAQLYAESAGEGGGPGAAAKLAVLTSLSSPGVTIDPIHRLLGAVFDAAAVGDAVVERRQTPVSGGGELAAAVAAAEQPAVGVWSAGATAQVWRLDSRRGPRHLPPAASELAAVLLHDPVLRRAGFPESAAADGTVVYRSDPERLYEEVAAQPGSTGFWLPPMDPEVFAGAVAEGDLLPPKVTRFVPKLVSGLVWNVHDSPIA